MDVWIITVDVNAFVSVSLCEYIVEPIFKDVTTHPTLVSHCLAVLHSGLKSAGENTSRFA